MPRAPIRIGTILLAAVLMSPAALWAQQPTVTSLSANPAVGAVPAGISVTWTATVTGGTAPYSFKFFVYNGQTWSVGQEWSAANTFVWTPTAAGTYYFEVWVRNAGSVAVYDAWRDADRPRTVYAEALAVTSFTPDQATVVEGTQVSWTATVTGGTPERYYSCVLFYESGASAQAWISFNTSSVTCRWTLLDAQHTYTAVIRVVNSETANAWDAQGVSIPVTVTEHPPIEVLDVTPSAATVTVGSPLTWTAHVSGMLGMSASPGETYKWLVNDGAWTVGQDWSTSSSWTWTPPRAGTYTFQVWAKAGAEGLHVVSAWRAFGPFSVGVPPTITITDLRVTTVSVVPFGPLGAVVAHDVVLGTPVALVAEAGFGTAPYAYKFFVFDGSTWSVGRDWSPSSTWTWVPTSEGTYQFQVWVRNAGSAAPYDAWRGTDSLRVTSAQDLQVSVGSDHHDARISAGTPVRWTAHAMGGSGPYTYKFVLSDFTTWSLGQDWSALNTWDWVPLLPGNYWVQAWVRNAGSSAEWDALSSTTPACWSCYMPVAGGPFPLVATGLTMSPQSPIFVGGPVLLSASADVGTGPYTFKFIVHNGISWSLEQDWSASNSLEWTPPSPGTYRVQVWIRNAGSSAAFDAWTELGSIAVNP